MNIFSLQKKFIYPWMTQIPYPKIKYPIIPNGSTLTKKYVVDKLRESIENGTIEFLKAPDTTSMTKTAEWKDNCKQSLNKHTRPVIESMITSHLMAKFGKKLLDFKSIHSIFDTDMPAIDTLMTTRIGTLIADLYIKFPYYRFKLKDEGQTGQEY